MPCSSRFNSNSLCRCRRRRPSLNPWRYPVHPRPNLPIVTVQGSK